MERMNKTSYALRNNRKSGNCPASAEPEIFIKDILLFEDSKWQQAALRLTANRYEIICDTLQVKATYDIANTDLMKTDQSLSGALWKPRSCFLRMDTGYRVYRFCLNPKNAADLLNWYTILRVRATEKNAAHDQVTLNVLRQWENKKAADLIRMNEEHASYEAEKQHFEEENHIWRDRELERWQQSLAEAKEQRETAKLKACLDDWKKREAIRTQREQERTVYYQKEQSEKRQSDNQWANRELERARRADEERRILEEERTLHEKLDLWKTREVQRIERESIQQQRLADERQTRNRLQAQWYALENERYESYLEEERRRKETIESGLLDSRLKAWQEAEQARKERDRLRAEANALESEQRQAAQAQWRETELERCSRFAILREEYRSQWLDRLCSAGTALTDHIRKETENRKRDNEPLALITAKPYTTYHFHFKIRHDNLNSDECLRLVIQVLRDWLNAKIKGAPDFFNPDSEDKLSTGMMEEFDGGFRIEFRSPAAGDKWAISIKEPELDINKDLGIPAVAGRIFVTDIALSKVDSSVVDCTIRIQTIDPVYIENKATGFRPAFVKKLVMIPEVHLFQVDLQDRLGRTPVIIENETDRKRFSYILSNENNTLPFILFIENTDDGSVNYSVDLLAQKLFGYGRVYRVSRKQTENLKDLCPVVQPGDVLLVPPKGMDDPIIRYAYNELDHSRLQFDSKRIENEICQTILTYSMRVPASYPNTDFVPELRRVVREEKRNELRQTLNAESISEFEKFWEEFEDEKEKADGLAAKVEALQSELEYTRSLTDMWKNAAKKENESGCFIQLSVAESMEVYPNEIYDLVMNALKFTYNHLPENEISRRKKILQTLCEMNPKDGTAEKKFALLKEYASSGEGWKNGGNGLNGKMQSLGFRVENLKSGHRSISLANDPINIHVTGSGTASDNARGWKNMASEILSSLGISLE